MPQLIKPGDVVFHNEKGLNGRVITTQDNFLNVEPEGVTGQEQWAASAVTLLSEGDFDAEALDARYDEHFAGIHAPTAVGFVPPDNIQGAGLQASQSSVDTTFLAHPDPAMVGSGVHPALAERAAELGLPELADVYRDPAREMDLARQEAAAREEAGATDEAVDKHDDLRERRDSAKEAHESKAAEARADAEERQRLHTEQHDAGLRGKDQAPGQQGRSDDSEDGDGDKRPKRERKPRQSKDKSDQPEGDKDEAPVTTGPPIVGPATDAPKS